MKKTLICLAAIAIATVSLFAGAGCSAASSNAEEIDRVLSQTLKILQTQPPSSSDNKRFLEWLEYAIDQMRKIDTTHCPQDFCYAYECFARSYEDIYNEGRKLNGDEGFLTKVYSSTVNSSAMVKALDRREATANDLNKVAKRYGAKLGISFIPNK